MIYSGAVPDDWLPPVFRTPKPPPPPQNKPKAATSAIPPFIPKETHDASLAQAMNGMTINEREQAICDVNGVLEVNPEEPDFIEGCLAHMQCHIKAIEDKEAYEKAASMSLEFVFSREFRLSFLRADLFNPQRAAERFVRHFSTKQHLFGDELLATDISLKHLHSDERMALERGHLYRSPLRDKSGRAIVLLQFPVSLPIDFKSMLRAAWYFQTSLTKEVEDQRKGVVILARIAGVGPHNVLQVVALAKMTYVMPLNIGAVHQCLSKRLLLGSTRHPSTTILDKNRMVRTRRHFGSDEEIIEKLRPFGIELRQNPSSTLSSVIQSIEDYHADWVHWQKPRDQVLLTNAIKPAAVKPDAFDVLFGRGRSREHTGNRRVQVIVKMHKLEYDVANKHQKSEIANRIIDLVHQSGGRFLCQESPDEPWLEVERSFAKEKICMFFRKIRRENSSK